MNSQGTGGHGLPNARHTDTPRALLRAMGFHPKPCPRDHSLLSGTLWELIYALAGRGYHLRNTDGFSDGELYQFLCHGWMDRETVVPDPGQGWHHEYDMAAEAIASGFAQHHPGSFPGAGRDRWLPPPGCRGLDAPSSFPPSCGPFEGACSGGADASGEQESSSWLEMDARAYTGGRWTKPLLVLPEFGVNLMPPDELTDATLPARLWEVLHALACVGFYLHHTDHMDDRRFYQALWHDVLREEAYLPADHEDAAWIHDFVGGDSEEEEQTWYRYYASEEERREAAEEGNPFPPVALPPRDTPPARRDWRLPLPPLGC